MCDLNSRSNKQMIICSFTNYIRSKFTAVLSAKHKTAVIKKTVQSFNKSLRLTLEFMTNNSNERNT